MATRLRSNAVWRSDVRLAYVSLCGAPPNRYYFGDLRNPARRRIFGDNTPRGGSSEQIAQTEPERALGLFRPAQ